MDAVAEGDPVADPLALADADALALALDDTLCAITPGIIQRRRNLNILFVLLYSNFN